MFYQNKKVSSQPGPKRKLKFIDEFAKFSDLDYFEDSSFNDEGDNSSMISISSSMNQGNEDDPF